VKNLTFGDKFARFKPGVKEWRNDGLKNRNGIVILMITSTRLQIL